MRGSTIVIAKALTSLLTISAALAGCTQSNSAQEGDDAEENPSYYEDTELGDETYAEFDERRDELEGSNGSFDSYGCTEDCSGHEAGYAWASERGIDDPDNCGGKSWSFEEGCRAYAKEQSDTELEEGTDQIDQ